MLAVVCYLWGTEYSAGDVQRLKDAVSQNLTVPHKFVCICDDVWRVEDIVDITAISLDPKVHVPGRIFGKLMTFRPDLGRLLRADKILTLDLDTLIVGPLDRIASRREPLTLWRNPARRPWHQPEGRSRFRAFYNSSVVLITPGARPDIYEDFRPDTVPTRFSTDQEWISYKCGQDMPYFDGRDGIYRLAREDTPGSGVWGGLPDNARIVTFPGDNGKPWLPHVQEGNPWIAQYRGG